MSLFKSKKKFPTENVPRSMDEINKEYAQLLGKCGQNQYLVYVYTAQLAADNKRLLAVNEEAQKRRELDQAAAQAKAVVATESTKETANEATN